MPTPLIPPDQFIGREGELRRIRELREDGTRLCSILGVGGEGKTRVALEYVRRLPEAERDRAVLVDLCPLSTSQDLTAAVAGALGLLAGRGPVGSDSVGRALASGAAPVLLLDNFEHLVDEARETLGAWLAQPGDTFFVVTSRVALGLTGEAQIELPPLEPDDGIALFCARAAEVGRDLVSELEPVSEIVRALDGSPLAIELAAGRLGIMSVRAIRAGMTDPFALLSTRRRDRPDRHSTLRAVVESTLNSLPSDDEQTLAALSVFDAGFDLDVAQRFVEGLTYDGFHRLQERALVRRSPVAPQQAWFSIPESVRRYLLDERLAPATLSALRSRHVAFMVDEARRFQEQLASPELGVAVVLATRSRPDLMRALETLAKAGDVAAVHVLLTVLELVVAAGSAQPPASLVDRVMALASDADRARIVSALGNADLISSAEAVERLAARLETDAAPEERLELHRGLAQHQTLCGRFGDAGGHAERAIGLAQTLDRPAGVPTLMGHRAMSVAVVDGLAAASSLFEECMAALERASPLVSARIAGTMGWAAHREGKLAEAETHYRRALGFTHELPFHRAAQLLRLKLASVERERGRSDEAICALEAALIDPRCAGDRQLEQECRLQLAVSYVVAGREADALSHLEPLAIEGTQGAVFWCALAHLAGGDAARAELELARSAQLAEEAGDALGVDRAALIRHLSAQLRGEAKDSLQERSWHPQLDRLVEIMHTEEPPPPDEPVGALAHAVGRLLSRSRGLVINPDERALTLPRGGRVELHRRRAGWLIVHHLAQAHRRTRDEAVSVPVLVQAGWPGEKILPAAAAKRLYFVINQLREAGLRRILLSRPGGYAIDPAIEVRWEESPQDDAPPAHQTERVEIAPTRAAH